MSFEIKYDRDGIAKRDTKAPEMIPTPVEEPVIEAAPVEVESPIVEEVESAEVDHVHEEEPVVQEKPASAQQNMKALREKAERAERERDEALKYIRELRTAPVAPKVAEPEEDYSFSIGADDLAEGKHLTKMQKHITKLEAELKRVQQQSSTMSVETRLRMEYPDIKKVLTADNIQRLFDEEPELAYTLGANQDKYTQEVTAYKLMKKLGIYKDTTYDAEKEMIKKNISKPKPVVSLAPQQGESPLTRANAFASGLTEELKKQLQREMHDIRRNH